MEGRVCRPERQKGRGGRDGASRLAALHKASNAAAQQAFGCPPPSLEIMRDLSKWLDLRVGNAKLRLAEPGKVHRRTRWLSARKVGEDFRAKHSRTRPVATTPN